MLNLRKRSSVAIKLKDRPEMTDLSLGKQNNVHFLEMCRYLDIATSKHFNDPVKYIETILRQSQGF